MSLKVFTSEELLDAMRADPTGTIIIEKKKNEKTYKGTIFLDIRFNIGGLKKKEGWFSFKDVELSNDLPDPEDKDDQRNQYNTPDKIKVNLTTTVSRSGSFGEALQLLQVEWRKWVEKAIKDGVVDSDGKKIHDLIQTTLSKKNKANPGGKIDDPYISLKVDFEPFPQKFPHKFLIGQPRSQFFDARTKYTDSEGREQYKPAMVETEDGKEEFLNARNIHKFITRGSKIVKGKVMMQSVAISGSYISIPMTIVHAVIMPGLNDGFSDEVAPVKPIVNQTDLLRDILKNNEKTNLPTEGTENTESTDQVNVTAATKDEINDVLDALN